MALNATGGRLDDIVAELNGRLEGSYGLLPPSRRLWFPSLGHESVRLKPRPGALPGHWLDVLLPAERPTVDLRAARQSA